MIGLALFVYTRADLLSKVIDGIRKNKFEKIYIFQDGLKNEKDRSKWEAVLDIINRIDFCEKEIFISEYNKGLANSIIDGMNYVFDRHECAIALEDDILLAEGFKEFMEACFEKYRYCDEVSSICGGGYGVPIPKNYEYDIFFTYRMSSIAFGTWKNRWQGFKRDPMLLRNVMKNPQKKEKLELAGKDLEVMLYDSLKGLNDTWATYWNLYQLDNNAVHVIPVLGYAKDIGRDGGGTNTVKRNTRYEAELNGYLKEKYILPENIIIDNTITNLTADLFSSGLENQLVVKNLLYKWIEFKQNGMSLGEVLKEYKKIYIYGAGKIASLVTNELFECTKIEGYIVESKESNIFLEKAVYDFNEISMLDQSIPIVITPIYDTRVILYMFQKLGISNKYILIDRYLSDNNTDITV